MVGSIEKEGQKQQKLGLTFGGTNHWDSVCTCIAVCVISRQNFALFGKNVFPEPLRSLSSKLSGSTSWASHVTARDVAWPCPAQFLYVFR